jgi:hypothetical protein
VSTSDRRIGSTYDIERWESVRHRALQLTTWGPPGGYRSKWAIYCETSQPFATRRSGPAFIADDVDDALRKRLPGLCGYPRLARLDGSGAKPLAVEAVHFHDGVLFIQRQGGEPVSGRPAPAAAVRPARTLAGRAASLTMISRSGHEYGRSGGLLDDVRDDVWMADHDRVRRVDLGDVRVRAGDHEALQVMADRPVLPGDERPRGN